MSLSTRNYSKETRSSSNYSRSSSYHTSTNNNNNNNYNSSSSYYRTFNDDRPLSTRLIERDLSGPSLAWNWDWNDPFFFDRFRWRFDNDFLKFNRSIPIYYRTWNNSSSSTRIIPIQYSPSSSSVNSRRRQLYKKNDDLSSSSVKHHDENSMIRENRLPSDDWPPLQDSPTRKRTSMTIFLRHPYVDQCEVPYYRQTLPTPTYPQSARIDYY